MLLKDSGQVSPIPQPSPSSGIIAYQVKAGDTLRAIARRYHTSVAAIVQENDIDNPNLIYPGETLCITIHDDTPEADSHTSYTVRAGDTLTAIASRFQTTVQRLAALNDIGNPNLIYIGERLQIPTTGSSAAETYTVRPGDTLWNIAQRYGTTVSHLAAINNVANPNLIYPGETLYIS